jgi:hypothetical protein
MNSEVEKRQIRVEHEELWIRRDWWGFEMQGRPAPSLLDSLVYTTPNKR